MEGIPTLIDMWENNDWAISFDIKDAYNHIRVHPSMLPLLGIKWKNRYFQFKGMPFGLSDAPRVFTHIMRKVVHSIRDIWNVRAVIYLDDLLLLHQDKDYLQQIGEERRESKRLRVALQPEGEASVVIIA
jgi:hypothetical protein